MEEVKERRLALIGPMGSGKSSLARRYCAAFGGTVFDIDAEFEKRHGEISAFFARRGEAEFRKAEQRLMIEAAQSGATVVSTGGGAVLSRIGMNALRSACDIVYLTAPIDVLEKRIKSSNRPLKNSLAETIEKRAPLYEKYADYKIDTSVDSLKELTAALQTPRGRRYDVVLCDADDTLLDFNAACACGVRNTVKSLGLERYSEAAVDAFGAITCEVWKKLERGELDRDELDDERIKMLGERLGVKIDPAEFNSRYVQEMCKTKFVCYGAIEFLQRLKESGARVYVITNGFIRTADERIKPLLPYVDGAFVSERLGAFKPDPKFFELVLNDIGYEDKNRVIVFGDSETSDIAGGIAYGLDTCLYDPSCCKKTAADFRVTHYSEFFDIV